MLKFMHSRYLVECPISQKSSSEYIRCFGYREFCRLWSEVVPYIRTMPPDEDICHVCQQNASQLLLSANHTEDEKRKILQEHLNYASNKVTIENKLKKVRRTLRMAQ